MTLKSLLSEIAYSLHRLTSIGQIAGMRTLMTIFLTQADKPEAILVFQKDQNLLLQLV